MPIIYGKQLENLLLEMKQKNKAIPAVNVTTSSTINAALAAAQKMQAPIIVQFSHGGGQFMAGKHLDNSNHQATISGSIAGAKFIHEIAKNYNIPIILHTDHCDKSKLAWVDGLLKAGKEYYSENARPLFSSHMLDLSVETFDDNISISKEYLKIMKDLEMHLEIELGVTGGEEDGVNNEDIENSKLYTQPKDVFQAWQELSSISQNFTMAASFGNVHGVYKPGNVHLSPIILKNSQDYLIEQISQNPELADLIDQSVLNTKKPLNFVFHGGSGSTSAEIKEAVGYGVIKMNLDTDLQWAYWDGIRRYEKQYHDYLQTQIGNPDGEDKPNKKIYDPRAWLQSAEKSFVEKLTKYYQDLGW